MANIPVAVLFILRLVLYSFIGKLRAYFNSIGRCNPYRPGNLSSNPCASTEVKKWLKAASVEQRRAHVTPRQAPPIFSTHLRLLVTEISRLHFT